jgi:hypothetical protein
MLSLPDKMLHHLGLDDETIFADLLKDGDNDGVDTDMEFIKNCFFSQKNGERVLYAKVLDISCSTKKYEPSKDF